MTRPGRGAAARAGCALAVAALVGLVAFAGLSSPSLAETQRTIAGSLQLDYLVVPTDPHIRATTLDGVTTELSLKLSVDFTPNASTSVKVCFACHGFEAAAAFVDLRASDAFSVRIGRFTPELGSFPQRGDPANHRSNDKPLPYDMGRMLHHTEWGEGILPAPWVDNGVELLGTQFIGGGRIDYAAYLLSGPKGISTAADLDFVMSRDPNQYYVDNNSEPTAGARLSGTVELGGTGDITLGASAMAGHYDPDRKLGFAILGADLVVNLDVLVLRAEYLLRRTDMAIGDDPASRWKYGPHADGTYDDHFTKRGFYGELEVPIGNRVDAFARFDGLIRDGNVLASSVLSSHSRLLRYTAGAALRISANIRLKTSAEYYQSNDLGDDLALHIAVATPF